MLQIQALALSHGCALPGCEPWLISNLPSACFLASLPVLLHNVACTLRDLPSVCTRSEALACAAGADRHYIGSLPW